MRSARTVEYRLWWAPLVRRMLNWGVGMALYWGWIPLLITGSVVLHGLLAPDDGNFDFAGFYIFLVCGLALLTTCFWMVAGGIVGALAAFYARAAEPLNPLKSTFFRRVGQGTFWLWACFSFVMNVSVFLLRYYSFSLLIPRSRFLQQMIPWMDAILGCAYAALSFTMFVFCAWRALNHALREQDHLSGENSSARDCCSPTPTPQGAG